jgi:hypothetical protein
LESVCGGVIPEPLYNVGVMKKSMPTPDELSRLAREAKALVVMAFRNGPIEDVHAGKTCPTCHGKPEYSHITQAEMRQIMKSAVDHLYTFLVLKQSDHDAYEALLSLGERYTTVWDEPVLTKTI